jgi:hypothetical protein
VNPSADGSGSGDERLWDQVGPRQVLAPRWGPAAEPRHPLAAVAFLWLLGLVGAYVAFVFFVLIAVPAGFDSRIDDALDEISVLSQVLLVVVVAPAIEETIFRLPLGRRLHVGLLVLSGGLAALYFVASSVVIVAVGGLVAVAAAATFAVESWRLSAEAWWAEHPGWVVWVSSSLFAVFHLVNFDVEWSLVAVLAVPFAVLPQLWLGLVFSAGRIRYGFWVGLVVHAAHNLTVWSVSTLAS